MDATLYDHADSVGLRHRIVNDMMADPPQRILYLGCIRAIVYNIPGIWLPLAGADKIVGKTTQPLPEGIHPGGNHRHRSDGGRTLGEQFRQVQVILEPADYQ